jgi:hypothetical protein
MGRVFIEEAMQATGINRPNLVIVCTYLVRTRQAKSAVDAIRRLEAGEFDGVDLNEEMIQAHQMEKEEDEERSLNDEMNG